MNRFGELPTLVGYGIDARLSKNTWPCDNDGASIAAFDALSLGLLCALHYRDEKAVDVCVERWVGTAMGGVAPSGPCANANRHAAKVIEDAVAAELGKDAADKLDTDDWLWTCWEQSTITDADIACLDQTTDLSGIAACSGKR
jgi:hypothetical protein